MPRIEWRMSTCMSKLGNVDVVVQIEGISNFVLNQALFIVMWKKNY
jgi:hypothetical protein